MSDASTSHTAQHRQPYANFGQRLISARLKWSKDFLFCSRRWKWRISSYGILYWMFWCLHLISVMDWMFTRVYLKHTFYEHHSHYCVNFGKVKGTYEKPWIIVPLWDYFVNYGILCCCLHLMHFLWTPFFALKIDVLKFTGSLKAEWRRRYPSKGSWVCHLLEVWRRTKY